MKRQNNITQPDFSNFLQAGALLRYGSDWILAFGKYTETSPTNNEEISVFCPDFYQVEEAKALSFTTEAKISNQEFLQHCRQYLESHSHEKSADPKSFWEQVKWQDPDLADFSKAFSHTQQLIGQGQIDKAVPYAAAKAQGTLNSYSLVKCLINLAEAPANLYVYGFWKDSQGIVGATPEILFEKNGKSLTTMALAGTMAKASDARGEQLLKTKKELHENELVVADIKQQLRPLGMVKVEPPTLLELPTLWHLISRIELKLEENVPPFDLIKRLHPTPALGVSPRRFGWRWMREWPQQNSRARFGAPFLMKVEENHWLCLVAIRNLQWNAQEMMIGSGCGVVRDSELEREWLELFYKRESVKKVLGIKS